MKNNQELAATIKQLSGMTYNEWLKIKDVIDIQFEIKQRKLKQTVELSTEEIENVILQLSFR